MSARLSYCIFRYLYGDSTRLKRVLSIIWSTNYNYPNNKYKKFGFNVGSYFQYSRYAAVGNGFSKLVVRGFGVDR